jgi:hypothetical protein
MMWAELLQDYWKRARLEINIRAIHGVGGQFCSWRWRIWCWLARKTPRGASQCLR